MTAAERIKCVWCLKVRTASDFEQQRISDGEWHRLCVRCAGRRLDNPWNALLAMRRVQG